MSWPEAVVNIFQSMPYQVWVILGVGVAAVLLCVGIRILRKGVKVDIPGGGGITCEAEVKQLEK